ncbi:MAG: translesion DNA synthesis-associated protein ImuA, partial [Undibacterium sp.]|nr:translesion DNA synthesis-associated protein ImuA [Undibacterium sp.]
MPSFSINELENISPTLWRASQLARSMGEVIASGHGALSAQLPGGGWPKGCLTELLIQEAGSTELQLLRPALAALQSGRIALLHPPYSPQALALSAWGIDISRLLWLPCQQPQNAIWAAEQILKNGACSALLFWQDNIKSETLRRLHLAAQTGQTLFFLVRSWK